MNISTGELLAASPMTELLRDVLSYSPDQEQHDIDVPTFTSRCLSMSDILFDVLTALKELTGTSHDGQHQGGTNTLLYH